jgi:uncharacterized protein (DUF983 family)
MRLSRLLQLRCPVCGVAKLFQGYFDNPERCPNCGFYFMRESGYFLPHVAIGYGGTVLVALGSWPVLVFGIWFVRYSKAIWLAIDLTLNPPSADDFESRGRK